MNIVQDLTYVNNAALKKTIENVKKNPQVTLLGFSYTLLGFGASILMSYVLSGPIGIFGGIIMAIVQSALVSSYLYVLGNVIVYNRFRWKDAKYGFTHYLWKVYGIFFIFYIGGMLLNLVSGIIGPVLFSFYWLLPLILIIVFNPLPEAIYSRDKDPLETVLYTIKFMRENWLNWLLPNGILLGILYILASEGLGSRINLGSYNWLIRIATVITVGALVSIGMLYRGHLFMLLSSSTIRKRQFMRKL